MAQKVIEGDENMTHFLKLTKPLLLNLGAGVKSAPTFG